jgi:hypothetical protein
MNASKKLSRCLVLVLLAWLTSTSSAFALDCVREIEPEVRALVGSGRARVLVMLQVGESSDEAQRAQAIGRAQDAVLSRLPQSHASVVRRHASIPMLALEIDGAALLALEQMTDVVVAVKSDRTVTPQ